MGIKNFAPIALFIVFTGLSFLGIAHAQTQNSRQFNVTIFLQGIGKSGDNANPTLSTLSNKTPIHTTRQLSINFINSSGITVATETATINYNQTGGNFPGSLTTQNSLPNGDYLIQVRTANHLRKTVPGFVTLESGTPVDIPPTDLVAGDVNDDNSLNILDFNILRNCYSDMFPPKSCDATNKAMSDINDDGQVNEIDYNIFIRSLSVQNGS